MSTFRVLILLENSKGKVYEEMHIFDTVVDVTRMMITYKPKRGSIVVKWEIETI